MHSPMRKDLPCCSAGTLTTLPMTNLPPNRLRTYCPQCETVSMLPIVTKDGAICVPACPSCAESRSPWDRLIAFGGGIALTLLAQAALAQWGAY